MSISKHVRHIRKFRDEQTEGICRKCKMPLTNSLHHGYCNRCWYLRGTGKSRG